MKKFKFKKINAFTDDRSPGNPAAGVYLDRIDAITGHEMQSIAASVHGFVNEVVYVFRNDSGIFLKYYSSECEVDFCGHGTIAVMFDLIRSHAELRSKDTIEIRVKDERLTVYNAVHQSNAVFITAPAPRYANQAPDAASIADALNMNKAEIDPALAIDCINAGLNTLIVPVTGLDQSLQISPDQEVLKSFCVRHAIDIILIFTNEASARENRYRTRVFAPKYGYLEDPATGSGNSAFGYYLLKNNLWNGQLLRIEQNKSRTLPNIVLLNTVNQSGETRVIFGGCGVVVIDGMYHVYDTIQ